MLFPHDLVLEVDVSKRVYADSQEERPQTPAGTPIALNTKYALLSLNESVAR